MYKETIQVVCVCLPTGENLWFEASLGSDYFSKVVKQWQEKHSEFKGSSCNMGAVELVMPKENYLNIRANNEFEWPEK